MKVRAFYIDPNNIIRKNIVKYLYATGIWKKKPYLYITKWYQKKETPVQHWF